jgi:hypothetical protein
VPAPQALESLALTVQVKARRDDHIHRATWAFRSNCKYRRAEMKIHSCAAPFGSGGSATLSVTDNCQWPSGDGLQHKLGQPQLPVQFCSHIGTFSANRPDSHVHMEALMLSGRLLFAGLSKITHAGFRNRFMLSAWSQKRKYSPAKISPRCFYLATRRRSSALRRSSRPLDRAGLHGRH